MNIKEKINALRDLMNKDKIDMYYIPTSDDHQSEYIADYFKSRAYMSGFSGSAGTLIVTKKEAGLWTDGRYFIQAEKQLKGTGIKLFKMRQANVPTVLEYISKNMPKNGTLAYDGKVVPFGMSVEFSNALKGMNVKLKTTKDYVDSVWTDRPEMPKDELFILKDSYSGESTQKKIKRIKQAMKDNGADTIILSKLEDVAWTLNLRGNDIQSTPVFYGYLVIENNKNYLCVDNSKINATVKKYLAKNDIALKEYDDIAKIITSLNKRTIMVDQNELNTYLYQMIDATNTIINKVSPVLLFRGIKNKTEVKNLKEAHVKDGVAITKFIYYVKNNIDKIEMSELSVIDYLYKLRAQNDNYIEPSFTTIAGFGPNAAMMHYSANEKSNAKLKQGQLLLVDSGGQYLEGTTDITRTIVLGKVSEEIKRYYTYVLKSMINLAKAKFLYGNTGRTLDVLARAPIWAHDLDYQCGTGHGVGYTLSVHEGPQRFAWQKAAVEAVLEEGMVITDEPGIYLPDNLGIRIENELVVSKGVTNEYGQFMHFETITLAPIDLDGVNVQMLNDEEITFLNEYHSKVYKEISPYLNSKEKTWLKIQTRKVSR